MIETAATRAAAGLRSMAMAVASIRQRAPDVSERLLPVLLDLQKAIEELIEAVTQPRKA